MRKRLIARRRRLVARYQGAIDRVNEELDTREIEQVEMASELFDAALLTIMSDADTRQAEAITGALLRLDEGKYGVCVRCGDEIDTDRLDALPEAAMCVACAEQAEQPTAPPVFIR